MYKFYIDVFPKLFNDFFTNDLTFITITQGIIVITTKSETERYSLIKQFKQMGQYHGMFLMNISKMLIQLNNLGGKNSNNH